HSDTAVRSDDLERSLLLLSDLPGVRVKGTLSAGEQRGTTDLLVNAQPGPWASGTLEADNFGGYYTGEYRLGGSLNLNNPLRLGDQFNLRLLGSDEDQRYYRAAYKLPLGPWSTSVGVAYSRMNYELSRDFEVLEAHGQASIGSVFITQPLIRSRTFDL
ncbi:ShlB/FhaC/HecB family hemolysin secretion/activation protein, partial [Pseudomonas sp. MWU13-2860]